MSLQLAANHLAAQGRGPDSRLVHMSPREVAGLQALAMSQGGSLSINPQTGLPEAGFLDKMLPMLLGVGITAATGGAAAPWMVGLGLGGVEAARTGSLSKGIMAGLGAYGGAGLGAGLMGAGAGTAGAAGAAEAAGSGLAGAAPQAASAAGPAAFGLEEGLAQAAGATPGVDAAYYDIIGAEPYLDQVSGVAPSGTPVSMGKAIPEYIPPTPNPAFQAMASPPVTPPPAATSAAGPAAFGLEEGLAQATAPATPMPTPSAAGPAAFGLEEGLAQATSPATPMPSQDGYSLISNTGGTPATPTTLDRLGQMGRGVKALGSEQGRGLFLSGTQGGMNAMKYGAAAGLPLLLNDPKPLNVPGSGPNPYNFAFDPGREEDPEAGYTGAPTGERRYFKPKYRRLAGGGPVEQMSNDNAVGANTGYPMADIQRNSYAVPYQQPMSENVVTGAQDTAVDPYTGEERMAAGGISHLGDYSDGGRLLRGPGDGVSDSIPAMIGNKQPARLADGEFVVPARIVSELGNGSTDAGARKLYAMMDRIQKARGKTTGKNRVAANTRSDKYLPA